MTTLQNRPNTALLVVDVQNGVVHGAPGRDTVCRQHRHAGRQGPPADVPVGVGAAQQQRPRQRQRRVADRARVEPDADEPLIQKEYGDSFEATNLESVLSDLGVGRLVVVGAQTDACIRSTLHGAFARGYDATLVADAHTTEDLTAWGAPPPEQVIAHTNLYWNEQTAPGRTAGAVPTNDVDSHQADQSKVIAPLRFGRRPCLPEADRNDPSRLQNPAHTHALGLSSTVVCRESMRLGNESNQRAVRARSRRATSSLCVPPMIADPRDDCIVRWRHESKPRVEQAHCVESATDPQRHSHDGFTRRDVDSAFAKEHGISGL